jgi:hypothetical protein
VKNVRHRDRVAPASTALGPAITGGFHSSHSKDRQLIRILLADISIYIIFSLMTSVVLMYQQFTQSQSECLADAKTMSLLLSIGVFSGYIPFCVGCYTNSLASKTFRHEIKNIIMCK